MVQLLRTISISNCNMSQFFKTKNKIEKKNRGAGDCLHRLSYCVLYQTSRKVQFMSCLAGRNKSQASKNKAFLSSGSNYQIWHFTHT